MAKNDNHKKYTKARLTSEDAALWKKYTEDVDPLVRDVKSPSIANDSDDFAQLLSSQNQTDTRVVEKPNIKQSPVVRTNHKHPNVKLTSNIDRHLATKLSRGTKKVEATLDLHGYFQDQAHKRLISFISTAQLRGYRSILVITGKGNKAATIIESSRRGNDHDFMAGKNRGILRQMVPRWLQEPPLSFMVAGFTNANQRDGGEGALYVQIRRKK